MDAYEITQDWTNLNTLTSLPVGTEFFLQNIGFPGDQIELVISATQPLETTNGYAIQHLQPNYRAFDVSLPVWVRYIREDRPVTPIYPQRTCRLLVQTGLTGAQDANGVPNDLFTESTPLKRRLKVSSATRVENQIARGIFFAGKSKRAGIAVPSTYYTHVVAGSRYFVVEDFLDLFNFVGITAGSLEYELGVYIQGSVTSSFTVTPNAPTPAGRAMVSDRINTFTETTIDQGVAATTTGDPDYIITHIDYAVDSQGTQRYISESGTNFFEAGRQLILAPGHEALIVANVTGQSSDTFDVVTTFFTSEIPVALFPEG